MEIHGLSSAFAANLSGPTATLRAASLRQNVMVNHDVRENMGLAGIASNGRFDSSPGPLGGAARALKPCCG